MLRWVLGLVVALAVACAPRRALASPPQADESTAHPMAAEGASPEGDTDQSAQPSIDATKSYAGRAVRVAAESDVCFGSWADVVPGAPPGVEHPKGTVVLAWCDAKLGPVLVEWDIATERALRRWIVGLSTAHVQVQIARTGGALYMVVSRLVNGPVELIAFDAATLAKTWQLSLEQGDEPSVGAEGNVIALSFMTGDKERRVVILDARTRAITGRQTLASASWMLPYRPHVVRGTVYVGHPRPEGPIVHALRLDGTETASFAPADKAYGTARGQIAVYGDHLFLPSLLGTYELDASLKLVRRHRGILASILAIEPKLGLSIDTHFVYRSRLDAAGVRVKASHPDDSLHREVLWAHGRAVSVTPSEGIWVATFAPTADGR